MIVVGTTPSTRQTENGGGGLFPSLVTRPLFFTFLTYIQQTYSLKNPSLFFTFQTQRQYIRNLKIPALSFSSRSGILGA